MKQWYALYAFPYSYSNEDKIPILPECICNKWQNMMQKHLRHTTKEKIGNNGKDGYFRFDDDNNNDGHVSPVNTLFCIQYIAGLCFVMVLVSIDCIYVRLAVGRSRYYPFISEKQTNWRICVNRFWNTHRTIVLQHSKKYGVCCHLSLTGIEFNPRMDTQLHMTYNLSPPLKFGNVLISNFISHFTSHVIAIRCWDKS